MKVDSPVSEDVVTVAVGSEDVLINSVLSAGVAVSPGDADGISEVSNISDDESATWDLSEMKGNPEASVAI